MSAVLEPARYCLSSLDLLATLRYILNTYNCAFLVAHAAPLECQNLRNETAVGMSLDIATGLGRGRLSTVPVLSYGFRPFFLGAAVWAVVAMMLWIAAMMGYVNLAPRYGAVAWHAHEFLFGYLGAAMTGFLLTAVSNWTGRTPIAGGTLLWLFVLWLAGRIGFLFGGEIGGIAPVADSLFLFVVAAVVGREIAAARNWRNVKVVIILVAFACANVLFHLQALAGGAPAVAMRLALSLAVMMLVVIGGRLVPSFTRNWLIARKGSRYPALFDWVDSASILAAAAGLVLWTAMPDSTPTGLALLLGAFAQAARLARWRAAATWREPLLLILHVGYAFVPLGFLSVGLSVLRPDWLSPAGAIHAWTAGAIGVMTLAVMTRVSLGHTGRPLTATPATTAIYVAAICAALARIAAPLAESPDAWLALAGVAWMLAFTGFLLRYGPILLATRFDGSKTC